MSRFVQTKVILDVMKYVGKLASNNVNTMMLLQSFSSSDTQQNWKQQRRLAYGKVSFSAWVSA